jgi:hypothetical protein
MWESVPESHHTFDTFPISECFVSKLFKPANPFLPVERNNNSRQNSRAVRKEMHSHGSDYEDDLDLDQYSTEVLEAALGVLRAREAAAKKAAHENKQE